MKYTDFTAQDWQHIRQDWTAWWNGALERPLVLITAKDPNSPPGSLHNNLVQFGLTTPPETCLDYFQPHLEATHYYGDGFPQWWLNAGPGIVAAFLGSVPHFSDQGDWGTTWFEPLPCATIRDMQLHYEADNAWYQHCQAILAAAVRRWGDHVVIGHTDLGGTLDILASLRGTQELLYDVVDAPEEVNRLTRQITTFWLRYYNEMHQIIQRSPLGSSHWSGFWSPGTGYILQSDFSYMISRAMFDQFVLPDLTTACQQLEYPFYHLDGPGELKHLDHLLSIPNLRGIQWQPGAGQPPADEWLDVLGRIRAAGKLCQVYVRREGALNIIKALGGKGFQFQIIEYDLSADDAREFLELAQAPVN
jgi:5-methyltetrahydrofolate--homocysteine methyltransferase